MAILIQILQGITGIVSLVCFIMVLIKMFQNGQTGLGIACIVLLLCFGIGALIALIVGWMNADRWGIRNLMIAWTLCIVISIALTGVAFATGAGMPQVVPVQ